MTMKVLPTLLGFTALLACGAPQQPPTSPASVAGQSAEDRVLYLKKYLRRFGYLGDPQDLPFLVASGHPKTHDQALHHSQGATFDEETQAALRTYQSFAGLAATGEVDDSTFSALTRIRCGVPDVFSFTTVGRRWTGTNLTYAITEGSRQIDRVAIRASLQLAFDQWSSVTNLSFSEATDPESADIRVRFSIREHGDGVPFDGPSGTLAHAFFPPPNAGALAGDAHFDDEEPWSIETPAPLNQIDLSTVVLHEIGHSLGLGHSSVLEAVMYPFYPGQRRELHPDDIAGIQSLYPPEGAPVGAPASAL